MDVLKVCVTCLSELTVTPVPTVNWFQVVDIILPLPPNILSDTSQSRCQF